MCGRKQLISISFFLFSASLLAQDFNWAIKPQFDQTNSFSEELAAVKEGNSWGYINGTGGWAIKPLFEDAASFSMGLASVKKNGKWGFVNVSGSFVIKPIYDDVTNFSEGMASVCINGKWGYINTNNQWVISPAFADAGKFSEGLAGVQQNGKWGFVNADGKWYINPQFDDIGMFHSGYAAAKLNGSWGFINKTGMFVINNTFQDVGMFQEGYAEAKQGNLWGYINDRGFFVIKPIYKTITPFINGIAAVQNTDQWGYIDVMGNWVIQPQFEDAFNFSSQQLAEVKKNGKWGYVSYLPITSYIKHDVEGKIDEWQKKGEFEKTSDYQLRVNPTTRNQKIQEFTQLALNKYKQEYLKKINWNELELSEYDADHETYLVKSLKFGDFAIPVSIKDAQSFKQCWKNMKFTDADFAVNHEKLNLAKLTIQAPLDDKKYYYNSNLSTTYASNNIEYNFAPVEVNLVDNSVSQNNMKRDNSVKAIGESDVDLNIPTTNAINNKTFAVIIGNENYQRAAKVTYAANDAKVFSGYCQKTLGLPTDNIRMYKDASYGIMLAALKDIQSIATAYHGDIHVIFYYAGHGIPAEDTKEAYLLPVDADGTQPEACYPLSLLYKKLQELNAKSTLVFMDACFSGAQRGEGMLASARGVVLKPKLGIPQGNMVVFSAATDQETAYPYKEKGHGLFTYFLLKKLQETKGNVTLGDLNNYLTTSVSQQSIVVNRKSQTPTVAPSLSVSDSWKEMMLK